jgi:hypothetical protein
MFDNVKDRGSKKWSMSMMLTEHVELLREWRDEDKFEKRPSLDDFDLQALQVELENAWSRQSEVCIRVWCDGLFKEYYGILKEIHAQARYLVIEDPFGTSRVSINEVVSIQLLD